GPVVHCGPVVQCGPVVHCGPVVRGGPGRAGGGRAGGGRNGARDSRGGRGQDAGQGKGAGQPAAVHHAPERRPRKPGHKRLSGSTADNNLITSYPRPQPSPAWPGSPARPNDVVVATTPLQQRESNNHVVSAGRLAADHGCSDVTLA